MVGTFERRGVRFQYPDNWKLSDDASAADALTITLQSPGSAFWVLQVFNIDDGPEQLVAEVLESMRREYEGLEATPIKETIQDVDAIGYNMQFYCLDLLIDSHVRSFVFDHRTYLMLYQAEDREFAEVAPVFLAMATSLLRPG